MHYSKHGQNVEKSSDKLLIHTISTLVLWKEKKRRDNETMFKMQTDMLWTPKPKLGLFEQVKG